MGRYLVVVFALAAACGGGSKKQPEKPVANDTDTATKPAPPPETEADRQKKRRELAVAIVPAGSTCLPTSLKDDNSPRLEIAAVGKDAIVCAIDIDRTRLLGPVACWRLDLKTGALAYQEPAPLPGRGYDVKVDDRCARGFCVPNDAKLGGDGIAHLAWNLDGSKVAVLIGDDVHIFDGASKAHQSSFSIRGDKGVTNDPIAIYFVGDKIFVEGADQGPYSAVWAFDAKDGSAIGPIVALGAKDNKPASTWHGAFSILDGNRVAVADHGYGTVTVYEIDTGKRTKIVRRVGKPTCKPAEIDTFWNDGDKVTDRCKESMAKLYGHLMGATTIAGEKSWLALLRNDRLGELAVLDAKTLAEKKTLKMPWCEAGKADDAAAAPEDADKKSEGGGKPKGKKTKAKAKSSDPEEGGE